MIKWTIGTSHKRVPIKIPSHRERVGRETLSSERPEPEQLKVDKKDKDCLPTPIWNATESTHLKYIDPWLRHLNSYPQSSKSLLQAEIDAFVKYMSLDDVENAVAERAVSQLVSVIRECVPDATVEVIGSRATGLASILSDIDLNVLREPESGTKGSDRDRSLSVLTDLFAAFRERKKALKTTLRIGYFLHQASVPIIAGFHRSTDLEFQLQSKYDSPVSTHHTKDWLNQFPTLRPLFLMLKQVLDMRALCNGRRGGLTSYPLLGMIVAALKFSEGHYARNDAAEHLLFFLTFYSNIDFSVHAISVEPLGLVNKTKKTFSAAPAVVRHIQDRRRKRQSLEEGPLEEHYSFDFITKSPQAGSYSMSLQDPANPQNDLGRAVSQIKHIQNTFTTLRRNLWMTMATWDRRQGIEPSCVGKHSVLSPLVGGDYMWYEQERQRLRDTGQRQDLG